jgi:hypothetical protein
MFSTTFVVGAGASSEVRFPVGSELKASIASHLDIRYRNGYKLEGGDDVIADALRHLGAKNTAELGDARQIQIACWRVRDGMPLSPSIDAYIDSHRSNPGIAQVGKLAIARSILLAEAKCALHFDWMKADATIAFGEVASTWFSQFFQLLIDGADLQEAKDRLGRIAVISFNYDRCLEHFLLHAFRSYFFLSEAEAADIVGQLKIFHPYGTVGKLSVGVNGTGTRFGADATVSDLIDISQRIRTYSEGTDPESSDIDEIQKLLPNSERVVFLGFAFHRMNIDLLLPNRVAAGSTRVAGVYATGKGLSKSDIDVVSRDLSGRLALPAGHVTIEKEMTCASIMSEYRRTLAL